MGPVVVATLALPDELRARLIQAGADVRGPASWETHLAAAEALVTDLTVRVDAALLGRAPRLRLVANAVAGFDHVDLAACRARGILVTHAPDVLTESVAELTWALLLATVRRWTVAQRRLYEGRWEGWRFWDDDLLGDDAAGKLLGIVGMGRIGRAVARRAAAFGVRLQYVSRRRLPPDEEAALQARFVDWATLLETSDIVSLHVPLTPATFHLLDAAALARMKPGSILLNTARGALVDEAALVEALRRGPLAAAGLDVFEHEPDVPRALLELPNVVALPHIGSATRRTRWRMLERAVENVEAWLRGHVPPHIVPDPEAR